VLLTTSEIFLHGLADGDTITFPQQTGNETPQIVNPGSQVATAGLPFRLKLDGRDPDMRLVGKTPQLPVYRLVDGPPGMTVRPGSGLPGEARGSLPYPKADISLATQSFGQGVTASALQIAAGYGAIANGGLLMRPYIVSKVVAPDGEVVMQRGPEQVRQVVSPSTAIVGISTTAPGAWICT
jgi:hypothetical protein